MSSKHYFSRKIRVMSRSQKVWSYHLGRNKLSSRPLMGWLVCWVGGHGVGEAIYGSAIHLIAGSVRVLAEYDEHAINLASRPLFFQSWKCIKRHWYPQRDKFLFFSSIQSYLPLPNITALIITIFNWNSVCASQLHFSSASAILWLLAGGNLALRMASHISPAASWLLFAWMNLVIGQREETQSTSTLALQIPLVS